MPSKFIPPCQPTPSAEPPAGPNWLHEVKWDGYRAQAHLSAGKATIYTRNGNDWSRQFAPIAAAVAQLKARSAILDGEAVVLDKDGKSDFGALRGELDGKSSRLRFCVFDLVELDGRDLRPLPLLERRKRLGKLLQGAPPTLIEVEALEVDGPAMLDAARRLRLEGIVSKEASAPYRSGRSAAWFKTKCKLSDTFTVLGFADEAESRPPRVGALYVGRRDGERIVYAGKIQIGLTLAEAVEMRALLQPLARPEAPPGVGRKPRSTWILPKLQAEVSYSNVTADGMLRHGILQGLRHDLSAAGPASCRTTRRGR